MTQITATLSHPPAATVQPPAPLPRQRLSRQTPPAATAHSAAATPAAISTSHPAQPARGLGPRGAKARTTGCPCRAPAMPNGRCRMHGGKSTAPRTPKGLADLAKARTTHGDHTAAQRAKYRHAWMVISRARVLVAADELRAYLPTEIRTRVEQGSDELAPPPDPAQASVAPTPTQPPTAACDQTPVRAVAPTTTGRDARGRFAPRPKPALRGRRAELEAARADRAMHTPWRAGIKRARLVKRLLTLQAQNARRALRAQTARIANLRIHPMNPGAEPSPTGPGEAANKTSIYRATGGEIAAPLAQTARIANPRTNPIDPTAGPSPTGPGKGDTKTSIQRGAVAPPIGPAGAAVERAGKSPLHRGTVPPVAKPFRSGCWAAPPPTIGRCQSWRRNSCRPPVGRR